LQLALPAFPDFLLLQLRDAVAAPLAQVINIACLLSPVIAVHVFPRAGELSSGEEAYDEGLIFGDVGIELG